MSSYTMRNKYLQKCIDSLHDGEVKVITGPRRSGKSWLLKRLFKDYLISTGVAEDHIIVISFDLDDETNQQELAEKGALKNYLYSQIQSQDEQYYIFLDEVQEVDGFEKVLNGLAAKENVDVYVTGSNSKFLSSDINTIFRGRATEIRVYPFSFAEFCQNRTESKADLWKEYYTYGGMPGLLHQKTPQLKAAYLQRLWNKTYIDDVIERNGVKNRAALEAIVDALCSAVGSLTNPTRIQNILQSVKKMKIDDESINAYIGFLENAFLFEGSTRFNIKRNKYFDSIKKYYAVDVGLRNARLNFRQQDPTHIMENVIYTELRSRGYLVDVGLIESREMHEGRQQYIHYEVDFIATNGAKKYYIQSAYSLDGEEKRAQELKPLLKINNSFQKIVIVGDDIAPYTDDKGIRFVGLMDFLLDDGVLG